ncbi:MAG: hypothetical protein ABR538_18305 [Candidatus Binatia bacterium]
MSSPTDKLAEMCCADFEKCFDEYVDELLDAGMAGAASRHVASCTACDREVTRWQQTRILLSTAVADFATAVDLSSLRQDVEAALGLSLQAGDRERRRSEVREPASPRRDARRADRQASRRAGREAASGRRGGLAAAVRFLSAATVSAATAAAAVLLLSPAPRTAVQVLADASPAAPTFQAASAFVPGSRDNFADVAPVAYTPPPLAKPDVAKVDGLEAAAGHLVSTWVQPKTNARVIWVQDRGLGAPVRTAGFER